jgi:5'-phosphate synthase pdxT subunit
MRIGLLALQGGFAAHRAPLQALGHAVVEVRTPAELATVQGLVLPGGESTTQLKLIDRWQLRAPLQAFVTAGHPVLATCAGLIVCARTCAGLDPLVPLGVLDVSVRRNAYGRQLDSFEASSDVGEPLVFIRAPRIEAVGEVLVIDRYRGEPIWVRVGRLHGACFHPELSSSLAVHRAVFGEAGA